MNNTIVASAIIGVSMIFSGLIISDNISFKDQHVIPLAGGAVKLGDIYKEEKLISAKLIFKQGEQVLVSQGNPDDFNSEVDDKIAEILKELNAGKAKNDERITPETLSVLDDAKLELVSAVRYNSEHQPMFTLTLEKKVITMVKGSYIKDFSLKNIKQFVESQQQAYSQSLFITK